MAKQPVPHRNLRLLVASSSVLLALVVVGWPSGTLEADERLRTVGVATLSFDPDGGGAETPLRHRVDVILSEESSHYSGGVLCRFELDGAFRNRRVVVQLDADLDVLLSAYILPFPSHAASLSYREMAPGAVVDFEATAVSGNVELFDYDPDPFGGVALHLLFDAVVTDGSSGEERYLTDAEILVEPGDPSVVEDGGVWVYDDGADYVDVSYGATATDCSGIGVDDDDDWNDGGDYDYWSDDGDDYWSDDSAACDGGSDDDWDSSSSDSAACDSGSDDWDDDDWDSSDCDTEASVAGGKRKVAPRRSRSTISRLKGIAPLAFALLWWALLRYGRSAPARYLAATERKKERL